MNTISYPSKDLVRAYLAQRLHEHRPPPTPEEIRRRLGWGLLLPELKCATSSGRNEAAAPFYVIQERQDDQAHR